MSDPSIPIAGLLLVIRAANAYILNTFFQPDEYFQSLEPAWQLAFGTDSGAWITWEWHEQLRSAIHPVLFSGVYKAAYTLSQWFNLSSSTRAEVLLAAPKVLQVPIAAAIDFYTWRLALVCAGNGRQPWAALLLSIWSPWQWYFSTRTFSNTLETMFTVMALTWWPWHVLIDLPGTKRKLETSSDRSTYAALGSAALACILRPTNAIIWITVIITTFSRHWSLDKATNLATKALLAGSAVLTLSVSVDRAFYGEWAIPQLNFLYFNVVQSLSIFYGRNRIDYYFTEGLPLLLTTALPFSILGLIRALQPAQDSAPVTGYLQREILQVLAVVAITTTLAFSSIAHKEVRFLYPILPILHVLAAQPLADYFQLLPVDKNKFRAAVLSIGLTINLYIMAYTALVHQRGVVDVTNYLRHEAEIGTTVQNITVGFLMPCHSTPWRSHLVHPEIDAWALSCEPPLQVPVEWRDQYLDEADIFYNHPGSWIDNNIVDRKSILAGKPFSRPALEEKQRAWPDYLIYFEHLEPVMNAVLDRTRYTEHSRFFNTHWHDDWRRRGDVIVQNLDTTS